MTDHGRCTRPTKQGHPCKGWQVSWWPSYTKMPDPQSCISHLTTDERTEYERIQAKAHAESDAAWLGSLFQPKQEDALAETARTLAETTANLDAYIERRAQEIAAPRIAAAEKQARERIAELERQAAADRQRAGDLETELRRQLDTQVRRAEQAEERLGFIEEETAQ